MAELKIPVLVEIANSVNELKKLQKAGVEATESVAKGFSGLKTAAVAAIGAIASSALVGFLKDATHQAAESEANLQKLNTALQIAGNYSDEASAGLQNFAEAIEATTKFEGDAIIANLAYLQSLTSLNDKGLKVAQKAAIDLSAALGVDLQTATQLVGKAANGEVGAFQRYGIAIAKGKDAAETFSNTLTALQSKFGGSAAAQVNTFSGAITQAENSFNNLKKAIGFIITQNPAVIAAIKNISGVFTTVGKIISANSQSFGDVIARVIKGIGDLIELLIRLAVAFTKPTEAFRIFTTEAKRFFAFLSGNDEKVVQYNTELDDLKSKFDGVNPSIKETTDSFKELNVAFQDVKELGDFKPKPLSAEEQKKLVEQLSGGGSLGKILVEGKIEGLNQVDTTIAGLAGATNLLLQGQKGAVSVFSQVIGGFADTILPGIGGAVGQIVGVLAQGPEAAAGFVRGFIEAIPQIIENIILAIPEVILALIEGLSQLPERILERVPEIIQGIIQRLPDIINALAGQMPIIATRFSIELIRQAPQIAIGFVDALVKEAPRFVSEMIKSIGGGVLGTGGGKGLLGGGGFLGLGFAEGGIVPPGFPNDSFPASLTSGELVIDKSTVDKLNRFIDSGSGGGGSGPVQVSIVLGEKELASVLLDLNQRGFRTA